MRIADYTTRANYQENYRKSNRDAINARKREWRKWGAYCNGTLCCTGTKREMENKVENERRTASVRLFWEAKPQAG